MTGLYWFVKFSDVEGEHSVEQCGDIVSMFDKLKKYLVRDEMEGHEEEDDYYDPDSDRWWKSVIDLYAAAVKVKPGVIYG